MSFFGGILILILDVFRIFDSKIQTTRLKDGGYLSMVSLIADGTRFYTLYQFNDNLELIRYFEFNNSTEEYGDLPDTGNGPYRMRSEIPPMQLINGDIVVLFMESIEFANWDWECCYPSIIRLNPDLQIDWVGDYKAANNSFRAGSDMVLDNNGNLVIITRGDDKFIPNNRELIFKRIDLQSGAEIEEVVYDEGIIHFRWKILGTESGFTVLEYWSEDFLEFRIGFGSSTVQLVGTTEPTSCLSAFVVNNSSTQPLPFTLLPLKH